MRRCDKVNGLGALGATLAMSLCIQVKAQAPRVGPSQTDVEDVYYDYVDDEGVLRGGRTVMPIDPEIMERKFAKTIAPIDNRIDIVTVGDGYTAAQLALYAAHATAATNAFFAQEPFNRYHNFYRVTQANVVSVESGVDNDPVQGIQRNTAMDMAFWCNGIERLLCVNVTKAYQFANAAAPDVDQVLAVANSTKYGGAGYPASDLATAAGGNSSAAEIAIHEFGHSIGNLADEYDYADGATYTGGETNSVNSSILSASAMAAAGTKWAPWLNVNNPAFDGLVSCFQGCAYYQFGLYRPSSNSKMRSLGRPFNLPSVEALVIEMYKTVRPIDDSTPTGTLLNGDETLFVTSMAVIGSPALTVQWSLDDQLIAGATSPTIQLAALCLSPGAHTVSVRVQDPTTWVRNEAARLQWMTQAREWNIQVSGCVAGRMQPPTNIVDMADLLFVIAHWSKSDACADIAPPSGDGIVNIHDLLAVVGAWGPCP